MEDFAQNESQNMPLIKRCQRNRCEVWQNLTLANREITNAGTGYAGKKIGTQAKNHFYNREWQYKKILRKKFGDRFRIRQAATQTNALKAKDLALKGIQT